MEPVALYRRLRDRTRVSFLLESAPGPKRLAQYSFIGFDPVTVFALWDGVLFIDGKRQDKLWPSARSSAGDSHTAPACY